MYQKTHWSPEAVFRFNALAESVETLPHTQFNMEYWGYTAPSCGTVYCMAGSATLHPALADRGLYMQWGRNYNSNQGWVSYAGNHYSGDALSAFFELPLSDVNDLFIAPIHLNDLHTACNFLRDYYVTTGGHLTEI